MWSYAIELIGNDTIIRQLNAEEHVTNIEYSITRRKSAGRHRPKLWQGYLLSYLLISIKLMM